MMVSLGEKVFWTVVALSTIGAAVYGYQRFKLIRPDLYGTPQAVVVPEEERKARIAEYQQKGDALTRAAAGRATRTAQPGETCVEGNVHAADGTIVTENGQPVHCAMLPAR
jgi:hypothetical protein